MISIVWLYDVVISDEECTCGGSGAQNINCKAHVPTSDCSSIGLYIVCLKSLNFEDYRAIYVTICKYLFRKNSRQKETKVLEDSCCLEWAETCLTGLDGTRTLHSLSSKDKQMSHVNHLRGKGAFEILSLKNSCTFLSSKDILFSEGYRRYLALCLGRDGILRERREHARGRNLANCGRICRIPPQICRLNLRNVEEMFQMINNAESHS